MRLCALLHHEAEGIGSIATWIHSRGHSLAECRLFAGDDLPDPGDFDWLILMGGPMSVHDARRYKWIPKEIEFVAEAVRQQKRLLGICLGAQMIAVSQGANVGRSPYREIGWFPVSAAPTAPSSPFGGRFTGSHEMFHWHGEMFAIPATAVHLACSAACPNQAFSIGSNVLALQFHPEITPEGVFGLVESSMADLDGSAFVTDEKALMSRPQRFTESNHFLDRLLDDLEAGGGSGV